MTKNKRLFGLFAILFVAIFSVGCVFATACKKKNKEEEEPETPPATATHEHDYVVADDAVWTWSSDHTSCTATATCTNADGECDALTTTVEAKVEKSVTEATCTADGETVYTATYGTKTVGTYTEKTAALGHDLTAVAAKASTCTETGYEAYWTCSRCNKMFSDEAGENEITGVVTTPALAHTYPDPDGENASDYIEWGWASRTATTVKLTLSCEECGTAFYTEDVVYTADGNTLTASTTVENYTYADTYEVPATETHAHSYAITSWNWDETTYTCTTATATCQSVVGTCDAPTITVDVTVTSTTTKTATCTEQGEITYTATAEGYSEADTKTATTPALGHEWQIDEASWTWDFTNDEPTASVNFDCSRCDTTQTINATTITNEDNVYTAKVTGPDGVEYTGTYTLRNELASVHLDFSDPATYSWIGDSTNAITSGTQYADPDGILTLYAGGSMSIEGNVLKTGGASSGTNYRYFIVDLSGYLGDTVSITAVMSSNSDSDGKDRSMYVSTKTDKPSLDEKPGLAHATSNRRSAPATLFYEAEITSEDSLLYLTYDDSILIYSIDIVIYGDADEEVPGVPKATITDATISETTIDNLTYDANSTEQPAQAEISLTITMSDGSTFAGTVEWKSSNEDVVKVDGTGASATITVVGAGTATITATIDGYGTPLTCEVTVTDITVDPIIGTWAGKVTFGAGMTIDDKDYSVDLSANVNVIVTEDYFTLEVANFANASSGWDAIAGALVAGVLNDLLEDGKALTVFDEFEWKINEDGTYSVEAWDDANNETEITASISDEGLLSVVFDGSVYMDGLGYITLKINAAIDKYVEGTSDPILKVSVSDSKFDLEIGDSREISASVMMTVFDDEYTGTYTWESSDENIVKITSNNNGSSITVEAVGAGTATIKVTVGSKSATCTITVPEPVIDSRISLTEGSVELGNVNTFANPNSEDLSIGSTTVDENGNIVYEVVGTASFMTEDEATAFWAGHAKKNDAYIIITITLNEGETVSWTASDNQVKSVTYNELADDNYVLEVIIRISGENLGEDKKAGYAEYTISDETGSVIHKVDFSAVEKTAPVSSEVEDAEGLEAALEAQLSEITITANSTITAAIEITYDVTLTIEEGATLSNGEGSTVSTIIVKSDATLTVEGKGTVDAVADNTAAIYVEVGGTAILNGGTYTRSQEGSGNTYYVVVNQGTMTINENVTVTMGVQTTSSMIENGWATPSENATQATAEMTINGGTFVGANNNLIKNDDYGKLVITGGAFTDTGVSVILNYAELEIESGTFTQNDTTQSNYSMVIWNAEGGVADATAIIKDGTFTGGSERTVYNASTATMTIGGGTFENAMSTVIENYGTLTINGGTFGGEENNSGITVIGNGEGGAIEINAGTFNGNTNDEVILPYGGKITMNGGTVNAADAEDAIWLYAGEVVINGGVVIYGDICLTSGTLTINGGFIDGEFYEYENDANLSLAIYGGTFTDDPSDYLGEGYIAVPTIVMDGGEEEETVYEVKKETTIEYDFTDTEWTGTLADQFAYTSDGGYITEYRPSDEISYDDDGILKSVDVPREKTSNDTVTGSEYKSSIDGGFKTGEKTQKKDSLSTTDDNTQVFTGYMMLDLSSFAEATSVTISIEFKTGSTGENGSDRTVALVSELDVWNNYTTGNGLAEATSGKNDTENTTLTYTVDFDELGEDGIIYIIWSENIKIYNITITVVE